mmetsp:Transcript_8569/g.18653  ORF Transcript_8569/g.18653 Transcript_8569/m.18653 type:complete len:165 (-) Transcript_8569:19-513(-)
MKEEDKSIISSTLGVKPVFIDAAAFTAGSRKRLYWTNLPTPPTVAETRVCLGDVLVDDAMPEARKAMCITTNNFDPRPFDSRFNCLWYPDGQRRGLHVVEAERILGFPDDYTTCAGSRAHRWRLLGNSFAVPVISHLLRPLVEQHLVVRAHRPQSAPDSSSQPE